MIPVTPRLSPSDTGAQLLNSLFVTRGNDAGKSFVLTGQTVTIGRDPENSILLQDDEVSRVHCSIFVESSRVILVDEGSSNGTFLNGTTITRTEIHKGDKIRVGKTQFEFNSYLQISLNLEDGSPMTASPTRIHESSLGPTKVVDQAQTDADSIGLELDVNEAGADSPSLETGRQFLQITNDLKFVYQASLTTSRTLDIDRMFHKLMELIFDWVPADRGCVFLTHPDTNQLQPKYLKKRQSNGKSSISKDDSLSEMTFQVDQSIVEYVAEHRVAVLSPEIQAEPRNPDLRETRPTVDEVICVPLEGQSKLLGVLYVDTLTRSATKTEPRFNRDNLRMMLAMAHQAAVAIENASFLKSSIEKERESAFDQMTAFLKHRANNILQGINGGAHLIEAGLNSNNLDLCKKGWEIASTNQTRIAELVGDLVILGGSLELEKKPCDLAVLIAKTTDNMESSLNKAKLACQLPSTREAIIPVDPKSIQTCLDYLLRLIIESTDSHGSLLEFSIAKDQNETQLTIRYAGRPIQSNDSSNLDPKKGFHSVALAVVEKIVEGHGGQLELAPDPSVDSTEKDPDSNLKSEAIIRLPNSN